MKTKSINTVFLGIISGLGLLSARSDQAQLEVRLGEQLSDKLYVQALPHPVDVVRPNTPQPPPAMRAGQVIRRRQEVGPFGLAFYENQPGPRTLIVRTSETAEETRREIQEDMAVMTRIIEKAIPPGEGHDSFKQRVLGITLNVAGHNPVQNLYIEGHGVIFMRNVDISLLPAEKAQTRKEKKVEPDDSTWEEARRELFGKKRAVPPGWKEDRIKGREFDEKAVAELKSSLIETLRNASNIRNLKESDSITLVVSGYVGYVDEKGAEVSFERHDVLIEDGSLYVSELGSSPEQATMVLRVRKSDVDDFAKKKLEEAEFRKKVSVQIY